MNKEILRLAIPNILSNISIPLLSTVDTALMGRLSEWHIGAVGVGTMIFNFLYWNFGFLRMGTTGMTAQAYGQSNDQKAALVLFRSFLIAIILAILMLIFQEPILKIGIQLMNVDGQQRPLVIEYFQMRIWAAPATLLSFALMGWFFGMQNAWFPLYWTIVANAVNIGANFFFVYQMKMEAAGVAAGTLVAQYAGLALGFVLLRIKYKNVVKQVRWAAVVQTQELLRFLNINKDLFIRTVCLTLVFGFFYSQGSAEGAMVLAVNVILLQFLNWMSYGVDGFAYAAESLVGKYYGKGDPEKTHRAIRISFNWGMGMALFFTLLYAFFSDPIFSVFTDQKDVIAAAQPYLFWMILLPLIGTPAYIWDGIFVGLTASKAMRNTMLISLALFLLTFWLLHPDYGNQGLWAALMVFLGVRGIGQWGFFKWKGLRLQ